MCSVCCAVGVTGWVGVAGVVGMRVVGGVCCDVGCDADVACVGVDVDVVIVYAGRGIVVAVCVVDDGSVLCDCRC